MESLAALADPTRRRIVELLVDGDRTAGELAAEFSISRPAVSRHLRVLREAGLVVAEPIATRRLYRLDPTPLAEIDDWLTRHRARWQHHLDALETELRRGARATANRGDPT
jgi:DNA-binding transcriptional ArsR family regulator